MITVFIGDITPDLSNKALAHDASAQLLTAENFQNLSPGTYYTSIGDLSDLNQFAAVLRQADIIVYAPPESWTNKIMQTWTEDYLGVAACINTKQVLGFHGPQSNMTAMSELVDHRRSEAPQCWVAGCSISHGVGVEPTQRWGAIVADRLALPVSFLTQDSSSISWAADQILRSDIRPGDLVFWGLTSIHRFSFWDTRTDRVGHCTPQGWPDQKSFLGAMINENFLASDTLIYEAVNKVLQVSNFCDKIGAVLIMGTVLRGLEAEFRNLPKLAVMAGLHGRNANDMFVDIGTDGKHPGPLSHQYYADSMMSVLQRLQKVARI